MLLIQFERNNGTTFSKIFESFSDARRFAAICNYRIIDVLYICLEREVSKDASRRETTLNKNFFFVPEDIMI